MDRPNVLLISADHWPGPLLNCAGHSAIMTPTLNRLAANGVRFTNVYATTPTCIPARRELMTGTSARTHGDRIFRNGVPLPEGIPTLAETFSNAGYQSYAVGKLHVYPQRSRIGFHDVILNEEGRCHGQGFKDDYDLYLERAGYAGQGYTHAMGNNDYGTRPWHLPEHCHSTNWTVREMARTIQRRDPTRPGFWYCSFVAPHPPVTPPAEYLEMYRQLGVPEPFVGDWARDLERLPYMLRSRAHHWSEITAQEAELARMGFYAQCTYIDHQLRLLIGTLTEQGLIRNTIIMFTSDHGDMLGNHGLWAKPPMFEWAANVPLILSPLPGDERVGYNRVDDRLACQRDIMPTLLELCGVDIPETVEGRSLISGEPREHIYCEHYEDDDAIRMVRDQRYKLIWYPVGNRFHLFDLADDPDEMHDLSEDPAHAAIRADLIKKLTGELYGGDLEWVKDGKLTGLPDKQYIAKPNISFSGQRGWR